MKGIACLKSSKWWHKAGTRSVKTFFQGIIGSGVTTGGATMLTDIINPNFAQALLFVVISAFGMAVISLCTSIAGIPEVDE